MTLEPKLADPVQLAIPAFILLVLIEIGVAKLRREPAYEIRDTAASDVPPMPRGFLWCTSAAGRAQRAHL